MLYLSHARLPQLCQSSRLRVSYIRPSDRSELANAVQSRDWRRCLRTLPYGIFGVPHITVHLMDCNMNENILTKHAPCIIAAAQSVRNPERQNRIFRNIYEAKILHPVVELLLMDSRTDSAAIYPRRNGCTR